MGQGHKVTVIDDFSTGNHENVATWINHPNFKLLRHDVEQPFVMEVDEIYHLASPASPPRYMKDPVRTLKTNVFGTIHMLELAKKTGAKLLLASTSEIYGDPDVHPQPESYWGNVNSIGPRACYDEGKRVAETLCYAYARRDGVKVRVARIFNTYGPRMDVDDGRVVSNFIVQALRRKPMTIYGSGSQTRSFQYVRDLVDGLTALMASNFTQPVNLGNPEEHSIAEFAKIIHKLVGTNSEIIHQDAAEDDPQRRKPDISRARKELNWQPHVSLKNGLRKTIKFFRKQLQKHPDNLEEEKT
jgi:UDP-glucuronate decarboxylase